VTPLIAVVVQGNLLTACQCHLPAARRSDPQFFHWQRTRPSLDL